MAKILFADINNKHCYLPDTLQEKGYNVVSVSDIEKSLDILKNEDFDFFITDIQEDISTDKNLFEKINRAHPDLRCISISGSKNTGEILLALNKPALTSSGNFTTPVKMNNNPFKFYDYIGETKKIKGISDIVKKVSATNSTVLITGESGTGKELIARAIHKNSNRSDMPMIVINCGAIPGELLESELFGHEKGAFTSAHRTRIGRFELANGGTIFLDEIGDMSPDLQVKLLRVIQNRQFERVGGIKSIHVDVRIISATNKNLKKAIEENKFREDLFYRLNVIPIEVPPLRDRKNDIPLLVDHFSKKLRKQNNWHPINFSDKAMKVLKDYRWTGNIRELENFIERIHVLTDSDSVEADELPEYMINTARETDETLRFTDFFENEQGFNEAIEAHQKELILHALNKTNWVKAKAAQLLKMKRTTLVEKIKKMDLETERETLSSDN